MEKKDDPFRPVYFVIMIIVAFACLAGLYFQGPNTVANWLTVAGGCLGVVVIVFVAGILSGISSEEKYNSLQIAGLDYQVRCQIAEMEEDLNHVTVITDIPDEPGNKMAAPIFCTMVMASHGLCVIRSNLMSENEISTDPSTSFGLYGIRGNPSGISKEPSISSYSSVLFDLFHRDSSNPLIIPGSYKLYCIIQGPGKSYVSETNPASESIHIESQPDIKFYVQMEIIILFQDYLQVSNLRRTERLNHPLKLRIIAVNSAGQYNMPATNELYKILYERIHPDLSGEDDSWAYRSRPIYW